MFHFFQTLFNFLEDDEVTMADDCSAESITPGAIGCIDAYLASSSLG